MIIKLGRMVQCEVPKGNRNQCNKFRSVLIDESLMIWTRVQSFLIFHMTILSDRWIFMPTRTARPDASIYWTRVGKVDAEGSFRRDFWPHQYMRRSFVLLNSWFAYETTFNTSIEGDKNIFLGRPTSVWKRENWNIPKPEKTRETGQNNREIPPKTTREHQRK